MNTTYLTTEELSERIKYDPRTIRQQLNDSVLLERKHYIKPFGRRKILYIWEAVEEEMLSGRDFTTFDIPMANGEICHG
jgi:hypothetical protein